MFLEALACGRPVVASRTAGNAAQILDNGRYGILVDPHDVEAIAGGIFLRIDASTSIVPGDRVKAFDRTKAFAAYQTLFEEVAAAKG